MLIASVLNKASLKDSFKHVTFGKKINKTIKKVKRAYQQYNQLREVNTISKHFASFFKPVVANTPDSLDGAHRIRHEVFCDELELFECSTSGTEADKFDSYASQCLIQHKRFEKFAGVVRVIMPNSEHDILPIEIQASQYITNKALAPSNFPRHEICEVSRIGIAKSFRRRSHEKNRKDLAVSNFDTESYSELEMRCFPLISVGLYMATAALAIKQGKKHAYFMVEPRLARSMKYIGIHLVQIGDTFEYVGTRAPFYVNYETFLDNLKPSFRYMLHEFIKEIS